MSAVCITCKTLPKALPKHRCAWCQIRTEGTDAEASAAWARREIESPTFAPSEDWEYCYDCTSWVPAFYMKTKKRCRGCQIVLDRSKRDEKQYGLEPGVRQEWFEAQGGVCWGCGNRQRVTGLAVHHDHQTGEPYFLACLTCNKGVMGTAFDSPVTLLRLALGMMFPPHRDGNAQRINGLVEKLNESK